VASIDKTALVTAVRDALATDLASMRKAVGDTRAAATHEEAKPENDKDTRALELSYLARGQAARVVELQQAEEKVGRMVVRSFDADGARIALTALVAVEIDGARQLYFVAPYGGGLRVRIATGAGDADVLVVTPESPVGKQLLGKIVGDEFVLTTGPKSRECAIVAAW
jgi:transcription elongation GreA/GreB family factor